MHAFSTIAAELSSLTNNKGYSKMRCNLTLSLLLAAVAFISPPTLSSETDPSTTPKTYQAEQVRADLAQLYENLQQGSYDLFVHTSHAEYEQAYQTLMKQIQGPMTQLEAHKLFMQFAALAKIAHTRIDFPVDAYRAFMQGNGKTLPMDFSVTPSRITISKYYDSDTKSPIKVGDEVIDVDGQPVQDWLAAIQTYVAADNTEIMASLTEGQLVPLLWLHEGERDSYQLRLRSATTGEVYEYTQETLSQNQQVAALDGATATSPSEEKIRDFAIMRGSIGYLKPGPFYNVYATSHAEIWDTEEFHAFIDDAFATFVAHNVEQILIDVRSNPGGSNSFSDHMLAWFADRPFKFAADFRIKVSELSRASNQRRLTGDDSNNETSLQLAELFAAHEQGDIVSFPLEESAPHGTDKSVGDIPVYVMIDRYSFSNAVSVAAIAQDYDFATVIGEKTADLATTYAAMESFTLDHTGIEVGYPKAHIIRPNGDLKADGVTPDVSLDFMAAPELSSQAKLERVLDYLQQK